MFTTSAEFYRLDPLTGCNNFLSFVETVAHLSTSAGQMPFSILHADLNDLYTLNQSRGHSFGDTVVRWMEIVLREESHSPTYRIGGDQFSVIFTSGSLPEYEEISRRIFARLNREGEQLEIPIPVAKIALVHYDNSDQYLPNDMMFQLGEAMFDLQTKRDRAIHVYYAEDLIRSGMPTRKASLQPETYTENVLRSIANSAIWQLFSMGKMLDNAQQASYLDAISGLPNMRAVLLKLEKEIEDKRSFTVLLTDGDNTRAFNNVSYACGDDMIRKISAILSEKLRPGDFLARWRSGDEFMAVLPDTSGEGGRVVGERFRLAIKEASLNWMFPITITTGIATYPTHGTDVDSIVDAAEKALKKGKDGGKDQVVICG